MSKPKKGKDVSKGTGAGGQKWDEQLIQEPLDTDTWKLCIAVLAGEDTCSEDLITALTRQINTPNTEFNQRRKFYSLSYQDIIKKALEGSTASLSKSQAGKGKGKGAPSPAAGAPGGRPPGSEALADLVKSQSVSEEGVSADTVARAVKMSLLLLRQEDMVRRQLESGRPGSGGATTPSKKKGGKVTPSSKGKPGKTGAKGVEEGIPMPSKPESTLRKRGEEVKETFFIDDEPSQGPEAYLILSGIKSADVITEMGRVGVAPGCLVRVSGGEKGLEQGEMEEEEKEKRIKSDGDMREFWEVTDRVLETCRDSGVRDTGLVRVEFMEDPEQERIQGFYDQLASHIYQLIEQKTQHKHYIESLSLSDITSKRATARGSSELYKEQLHSVPNQCSSIVRVVDSLLQQVCVNDVTHRISIVDTEESMSQTLQETLNRIKLRVNMGSAKGARKPMGKVINYPIIYEGDKIRERESLFEVSGRELDRRGVEKRMLDTFKVGQLVKQFPTLQEDERSRVDTRYQQLIKLAGKSETPLSNNQLQSLLITLSFAEMVHSPSQQLFDDPYPNTDRDQSIISLTPLINNINWSEPLSRDVISQRIQTVLSANSGYPAHITKYHKQSDKLLILFHPLVLTSDWDARILTPMGFYLYQQFLHSNISPLVDRVWQLNSSEKDKLLAHELTPTPSQASLTQLSGDKEKPKDGRGSSINKSTPRGSRTSRLKGSRVSSPCVDKIRERETSESREDLLSGHRSDVEHKLLLLTGYDLGDVWYAGRGGYSKMELSENEFISSEQRAFHSSSLTSVTMQYSHFSGVLAGISLLLDKSVVDLKHRTDGDNDVITPATVLEPSPPLVYASYRVSLPSGIKLSLSPYGKLGGVAPPKQMLEDNEIRQLEEDYARTPSPSMPPATSESKLGKGGRGKKTDDQLVVEQQRQLTEEKERRRKEIERLKEEKILNFKRENKYQTLFASTEYGLQVICYSKVDLSNDVTLRDGSDGSLRVTQSYPNPPSISQPCDKLRCYPASLEASRSYFEDGTVIKLMRDTTVQLLWPDGSSARSLCDGELDQMNRDLPDLAALNTDNSQQTLADSINKIEFSLSDKQWMYTDTQGQRSLYKWTPVEEEVEDTGEDGAGKESQEFEAPAEKLNKFSSFLYKEPLLKSWQRDPVSEEEMMTREDQLISVFRKDGTRIVQFSDGTRLTSSNTHSQIQIECAGYAKVRFSTPSVAQATVTLFGHEIVADRKGTYSVKSDDVICKFTQDGNSSLSVYNASEVKMSLVGRDDWIVVEKEVKHAINKQFQTYLCKQKGKQKCLPVKPIPRMFVLSRDGSGVELLSKESAEREFDSWSEREGVLLQSHALPGDHSVVIHSAISPITTPSHLESHLSYTEDDIVPANLRTQHYFPIDLNTFKKKGRVFGSGVGRGLDIGSVVRDEGNKKETPRAFWRRELLEHKPFGQEVMDGFVASLNELNSWWDEIKTEKDSSPMEIRTDSVQHQANDIFNKFGSLHLEDNDDKLIEEYTERVLSPPSQERRHATAERRPEKAEEDRLELEEFQANLVALRTRDIPGYFDSEDGNKFLQQQQIQRLTHELPIAMRRGTDTQDTDQAEDTPSELVVKFEKPIDRRVSELSQDVLGGAYASTSILLPDNSGSSLSLTTRDRPDNPSPHVSTSADPSIATTEESPTHSPTKLPPIASGTGRPHKPTPVGAGSENTTNPIPDYLFYNVAGIPRTAPVKLPNSLKVIPTLTEYII